jgi:hypothetical protein
MSVYAYGLLHLKCKVVEDRQAEYEMNKFHMLRS